MYFFIVMLSCYSILSLSLAVALPAFTSSAVHERDSTSTDSELQTLIDKRVPFIIEGTTGASSIPDWLSTLDDDGKWPDSEIDYTTGCDAQRANWPAQFHWQRISTFAAAWRGPLPGATQFQNDSVILDAISRAMDWWFERDFTVLSCLDSGGTPACPCGTPGLWNTNWFSNIDLIPSLVAADCLLLADVLTDTQHSNCSNIALRAYGTFDHSINGAGFLTGANTLDVASIGIDIGLLNTNQSVVVDAYRRVHSEVVVQSAVKADGVRPDGSFGQHTGLLYNGNYGKDYTNDVLKLELVAANTSFQATNVSKSAVNTLLDGSRWMIFMNSLTQIEHWDFSTLPRFISFPVIDNQATGNVKISLTQLQRLGTAWNSDTILNVFNQLNQGASSANIGGLTGIRPFWNNDYLVRRGGNYVSTVKGYSSRTRNTECSNSQNPLGFHLADGTLYTYIVGDEYEDIAAAWDWNLIPGTTVDYGATALSCSNARWTGVESFVGSVSDGQIGAFAMKYTNPSTQAFSWQKSWFFFADDLQHVMISDIISTTVPIPPIFSVLDQKRHSGPIYVDGSEASSGDFSNFKTLWHSSVGYTFDDETCAGSQLSLSVGNETGTWSSIGTSKQPPEKVDLFAAWLDHTSLSQVVAYTIHPGIGYSDFHMKSRTNRLVTVARDTSAHAVIDTLHNDVMTVFWTSGQVTVPTFGCCNMTIQARDPALVMISQRTQSISVSDPSQTLSTITLVVRVKSSAAPLGEWSSQSLTITMPSGGLAGQSVSQSLEDLFGKYHC